MPDYDTDNIFARILREEVPCKKICEGKYYLSFHDIFPKAPVHALVIPKGNFINFHNFIEKASDEEIIDFHEGTAETIKTLSLIEHGYRIVSNNGNNGGQEIPHFHIHILGGEKL